MQTVPQFPALQLLIESEIGVGLADQEKRHAFLDQPLTPGVVGVEGIPQKGNAVGPRVLGILAQPAVRSGIFTSLFVLPILGGKKLGGEGKPLLLAWRYNHRGQSPMRGGRSAMGAVLDRAVGTRDFLRGEILPAIQDYQEDDI